MKIQSGWLASAGIEIPAETRGGERVNTDHTLTKLIRTNKKFYAKTSAGLSPQKMVSLTHNHNTLQDIHKTVAPDHQPLLVHTVSVMT